MTMYTIEDIRERMRYLKEDLGDIVEDTLYLEYGDLSQIAYDTYDPNQRQEMNTYKKVIEHLVGIITDINDLTRPKSGPLILRKNDRGRYEAGMTEYTAGTPIEYLRDVEGCTPDGDLDTFQEWCKGIIEYSHEKKDYFIKTRPNITLEGLRVRERLN